MKAILEFQLPEDSEYFECASKATDLYFVLWDLDQYLRATIKYNPDEGPKSKTEEQLQAYQEIRDHLRELMEEKRVDFEMLS